MIFFKVLEGYNHDFIGIYSMFLGFNSGFYLKKSDQIEGRSSGSP